MFDDILENSKYRKGDIWIPAAAIVTIVSIAVVVSMGTGGASASMQSSGFTVNDASVNASSVESIWLMGGGTATFSGLPSAPTEVTVAFAVSGPGGEMHDAGENGCLVPNEQADCTYDNSTSGEVTFGAGSYQPEFSLFDGTPWTSADFEPAPGETIERDITVRVDVEVVYDGGSVSTSAEDTATITVTNPESSGGGSGGNATVSIVSGGVQIDIRTG